MKNSKSLDTGNQLLLLQGLSLIEDGLQFIDHSWELPNEYAEDAKLVLRKRFTLFKDCVLCGEHDSFIIDNIQERLKNVTLGGKKHKAIDDKLSELRLIALKEHYEQKAMEDAENLKRFKKENAK